MTGKTQKATLKTLQVELNNIKEELVTVKTELSGVKNELAEVKNSQKREKETNQPNERINFEDVKNCNICGKIFDSKRELLLHVKEKHTKQVKCKSCEDKFEKNSDL